MDIAATSFISDLRARAILLDIDGTIIDLAPAPQLIVVPPELRGTLAELTELTHGALALVSGRSLQDIDRIFQPLRLPAIGGHGAEIRTSAAGATKTRVGELSTELRNELARIAELAPGILVEDKGYSVALHYRLAPEKKGAVHAAVDEILRAERWRGAIEVLPGKRVIEVKPSGISKASAVCELMRHRPFADRRPIFVGDDTTDVPVFGVVPQFGGLAFSVGNIAADVDGNFDTPETVRAWLRRMAADGRGASG